MKGHIRKHNGRWAGVIEMDRDPITGKRKQKWIYADTKRECQEKVNEMIYQLQINNYVEESEVILEKFLYTWLEEYTKHTIAPSTYVSYEVAARLHINPYIGKMQLSKIKPFHVQSMYGKLLAKGLSTTSVLYVHKVLRQALNLAVEWNMIHHNVTNAVKPPQKRNMEYTTWENSTIVEALTLSKGTTLYLPILLGVTTGMRQGEICGLQWQDVDLKKGYISVRYTYQRVNGENILKETKTKGSRRLIAIPQVIVTELEKQRLWQKENKLFFGQEYELNTFVNTWEDGKPVLTDYVCKAFAKFVKNNNLPKIRFHDLRHTHATELLKAEVNPKIVSERLGHSNIRITLDTYSHVIPSLQKEAAEIAVMNLFSNGELEKCTKKS